MEELLKPLATTYTTKEASEPIAAAIQSTSHSSQRPTTAFDSKSPNSALQALRGQPDYETLTAVLRYLAGESSSWSITRPSPQASQIVNCLATEIATNYWAILKEESGLESHPRRKPKKSSNLALFLKCLRSTTGINAILRSLDIHVNEARKGVETSSAIVISLQVLCALLDGDEFLSEMWFGMMRGLDDDVKGRILAQEMAVVIGSGKIIARSAEAETMSHQKGPVDGQLFWVSQGHDYSLWLGRNITSWVKAGPPSGALSLCANLLTKALRLAHPNAIIDQLFKDLLLDDAFSAHALNELLSRVSQSEQQRVVYGTLRLLSERFLDGLGRCESEVSGQVVSAAGRAIDKLVGTDDTMRDNLVSWLTSTSGAGIGQGIGIRRAVLAVLSQDRDRLVAVLEKSLAQFGDQLYIKHAPLLQQEAHAQVLLLSSAYVHETNPIKLKLLLRSSTWLNAISNRLAASQSRSRLLGMIVGEALSGQMDNNEKKLDFHMDETSSEEAKWYKGLVQVRDSIGLDTSLLLPQQENSPKKPRAKLAERSRTKAKAPAPSTTAKRMIIEVIQDASEDEDFPVYGKPDSDAEDSDDDPTLVRRDKPKAPVYIRDLIRYLRDTENYDHQKLGLTTAPTLIRRKANYGTEVKDHAQELASLLVGVQDKFEIEDFADLKMQGMIAVVVAQPQVMGQWFAKTFFDGDYSISQRASILVALGLSAREIAGYETSRFAAETAFPSKSLPAGVERLYLGEELSRKPLPTAAHLKPLPPNALERVAKSVTSDFLAPIAATAADSASGPDALKLATYKSRLKKSGPVSQSADSRRASKATKGVIRAIPNTTAQLLSTSFFFPLTARFQAAMHSRASCTHGIVIQPYLLSLLLTTLAVVLHAAGPSTLALPQMTAELWALLLGGGVRAHSVGDLGVTRAVLFAVLALLDVNENRMRDLCRDHGREVVETQEWVTLVFEATRGEDGGEENEVKMLAAGILIRLREGMEKYRMLMVGDILGFG